MISKSESMKPLKIKITPEMSNRMTKHPANTIFKILLTQVIISVLCIVNVISAYQPYKHTDPDYAASVHDLKSLVLVELYLLPPAFSAYTKELRSGSHVDMKSYLRDFETSNVAPLNGKISLDQFVTLLKKDYISTENFADDVVKHVLKSYRTIRRFVRFIDNFPNITKNEELMESFRYSKQLITFPKESDVKAAAENIIRVKKMFRLSVSDLFKGQLTDLNTKSGLTVTQFVEIADHASSMKMYSHSIDMYDGAIKRCGEYRQEELFECSVLNLTEIARKLDIVIEEHDKLLLSNRDPFDQPDYNLTPPDSSPHVFDAPLKSSKSPDFLKRKHLQIDQGLEAMIAKKDFSDYEKDYAVSPFLFEKLCRGDSVKELRDSSVLNCYYFYGTHPTYLIGPLKVEVHNENPQIIQVYEVISDREIKELQTEVQEEMRQSRTTAIVDGEDPGQTSRFRTSANAWIEDTIESKFTYLNERISRITGLNTTGYFSSEIMQIAAYNPGCHYTPHNDAMFEEELVKILPETEFQRGDRMMTFMVYLSDVEKGGGTCFPTLKTVVNPVKGSGVLWYNLNSDGTINYNLLHGGCIVLSGTKWIANKWIRSNDQMFIKKCPKNQGEPWRL